MFVFCKKKKIRQTLKALISGVTWQIQLKFRIGGALEICTENFVCFCSGSVELQKAFYYLHKIHTVSVMCPRFLGLHDTLPCALIRDWIYKNLTNFSNSILILWQIISYNFCIPSSSKFMQINYSY